MVKLCLNCGKELTEELSMNKYCCQNCQLEYQYKQYIIRWKEGLETGIKGKYGGSRIYRKQKENIN